MSLSFCVFFTAKWNPPLPGDTHDWIVKSTAGYCGADMKALCAEAALVSLRRCYPQVYESNTRLSLDPSKLMVRRGDFAAALNKIVPCSQRTGIQIARQLDPILKPLLHSTVLRTLQKISALFPPAASSMTTIEQTDSDRTSQAIHDESNTTSTASTTHLISSYTSINQDSEEWVATLTDADVNLFAYNNQYSSEGNGLEYNQYNNKLGNSNSSSSVKPSSVPSVALDGKESWLWSSKNLSYRPRFMLIGSNGMGQDEVAAAVLHHMESLPTFSLDIPSLVSDLNAHSADQALVCRVQEACRVSPSVVYLPNILHWWASASEPLRTALFSLTELPTSHLPVLWLSTLMVSEQDVSDLQHSYDLLDPSQKASSHSTEPSQNRSLDHENSQENDNHGSIDTRLLTLLKWLSGREDFNKTSVRVAEMVEQETPATSLIYAASAPLRTQFFQSYFSTLYQLPFKIYNANISILKSRTQKLEIATENMTEDSFETKNGRKLRSSGKDKKSNVEDSPDSHKADLNDEDKQYRREIRTFFRAALSELMREKRCHVFNRPVDPEVVFDYYDVVKCPMDLETMRMKVDDDVYPTLAHFLRDITQIVYNAKMYNPLTRADQRGRSIVHAGHGMIDMVESHAFHFKEELGYDLFRKCEGIAMREGCDLPRSKPQSRDRMSEIDKKYYALILQEHQRLRREEGDQSNDGTDNDDKYAQESKKRSSRHVSRESDGLNNSDSDTNDDDNDDSKNISSYRSTRHSTDFRRTSTSSQSISHEKNQGSRPSRLSKSSVDSADSIPDMDFFACMDAAISRRKPSSKPKPTSSSSVAIINDSQTIEVVSAAIMAGSEVEHAEFDESETMVGQTQQHSHQNENENDKSVTATVVPVVALATLTDADIDHLPIIVNLRVSIDAAQTASNDCLVESLSSSIVDCTENWSVSQLMALMTSTLTLTTIYYFHYLYI